ncbi:MAG: transmembrane protein [Methylibium sp. NZG]|nr:MAG: transmembrane protein [Methylibium sp. NZG]
MTVHSMPAPQVADAARRTARGRLKMLLVLLVCASPVIASYFTYFVIRPDGRTNYSELILPSRALPDLALTDLTGAPVKAATLKGQWLLVVVSGGACDALCERHLWLQRQLRETLGREKDRLDKLWLITDTATPRPQTLQAITTGVPTAVLRVPEAALAQWLAPAAGKSLGQHLFIVDPMGEWMMRVPGDPEPSRLKRDVEKLLRASKSWDLPGR